jgi:hypothetical protein
VIIGGAVNFKGDGDYISTTDIAFGGTSPISVCAWFNVDTVAYSNSFVSQGTEIVLRSTTASTIERILNSFNGAADRIASTATITVGSNNYGCGTYSPANGMIVYVNGNSSGQVMPTGAYANSAANFDIGRQGNGTQFTDGRIDQVRISSVERSGDWIRTEYNNQSNPSSFYMLSPVEAAP